MKYFVFIVCLCVYFVYIYCDNGPEIEISSGILQGKYMITKLGRKFSGFLGIPFAKPPVGDLRFKDPIPNDPWSGIRQAVEDAPVCTQRNPYVRSTTIEGQEDCLYLNVYTPQLPSYGSDPLPVMVFFHGGGWVCGAGTSMWYGPELLLDREVVLVVPNFRLGPLGFLSTQDDVVPGNMAMKDQVMVLKWIQKNIAAFGGDPNSVTIFGESAGGASVHLHMVSPVSKGLFHRGISQSGTSLCSWAFALEGEPRKNTEKLAKSLNCPTASSEEMIDCLRKIDAHEIIGTDQVFWEWDYDPMIPFKPMVEHKHDGAFLMEHPRDLIKQGRTNKVPWITGITSSEGALRVAGIFGNPHLLEEFNKDFDRIAPISLFYSESSPEPEIITKRIKEFYFSNKNIDNNTLQEAIDLYTDAWFLAGIDESIKLHLKHDSNPIYFYYFDHRGEASFSAVFGDPHRNYGVCHADELQYLFPVGEGLFPDNPPSDADKKVAEILTNLWVNFAKTGNPNYENNEIETFVWEPVKTNDIEYLHIKSDREIKMQNALLTDRAKFWASLPLRTNMDTNNKIQDEL